MRSHLRTITASAIAVGVVAALTGCVGSGGSSPSGGGDDDSLTIWHAYAGQDDKVEFITWALEGFKKEHPDADIKEVSAEQSSYKTKLQTAMSTGDVPDVFYTLPGGFLDAFVQSGQVASLDDALAEDGWGDGFIPAAMDSVSFDGSTYAVPIDIDAAVVWYNTALFEDKGWEVPSTWDEFMTLSETIAADGIVPVALGNKDSWPATFWFQYGQMRTKGSGQVTDALSGDAEIAFDPAGAEPLQSLAQNGFLPTGANGMSDQEANLLFLNGQAAMVLNGTWQIGMSADAPEDFELGYFPFPTIDGGTGDPSDTLAGVAAAFAVSEKAKDKELAIEFLQYMTSPDVMKKYVELRKTMVTLQGATTPDVAGPVLSGIVTDIIEPSAHLDAFYDTALPPKATTVYYSTLQGLIEGSIDAQQAVDAIDEAVSAGE